MFFLRAALLGAALVASGCHLIGGYASERVDAAEPAADASTGADVSAVDGPASIVDAAADSSRLPPPDAAADTSAVPDLATDTAGEGPPGDGAVASLVTVQLPGLLESWLRAQVPCIDEHGKDLGGTTGILDSEQLLSSATRDVASQLDPYPSLKQWLADAEVVLLVWNPDACGNEEPDGDGEWANIGMLVRGAVLAGSSLRVPPLLSAGDLNIVDATNSGEIEVDSGGIDDCGPDLPPNTGAGLAKAKHLLLQLVDDKAPPPTCS